MHSDICKIPNGVGTVTDSNWATINGFFLAFSALYKDGIYEMEIEEFYQNIPLSRVQPGVGWGVGNPLGMGLGQPLGTGLSPPLGTGLSPPLGTGLSPPLGTGLSPPLGYGPESPPWVRA